MSPLCWNNEKVMVVNKPKVNPTKITKGVFSVADEFKGYNCLFYTYAAELFCFMLLVIGIGTCSSHGEVKK